MARAAACAGGLPKMTHSAAPAALSQLFPWSSSSHRTTPTTLSLSLWSGDVPAAIVIVVAVPAACCLQRKFLLLLSTLLRSRSYKGLIDRPQHGTGLKNASY